MAEPLGDLTRTHTCGALRATDVGAAVVLLGWVHRIRDLGGVTFIDIRDRAGVSQVVVRENVGTTQGEDQEHLSGPTTDSFDLGQCLHHSLIRQPADPPQINCSIIHLARKIGDVGRLLL